MRQYTHYYAVEVLKVSMRGQKIQMLKSDVLSDCDRK